MTIIATMLRAVCSLELIDAVLALARFDLKHVCVDTSNIRLSALSSIKGWCVGPDQKPACGRPLFIDCKGETGMATITDAGSPSLI
jgi:hypothetical protein